MVHQGLDPPGTGRPDGPSLPEQEMGTYRQQTQPKLSSINNYSHLGKYPGGRVLHR